MNELFEAFSAVPLRILDLLTDLAERFALPRHLDRRQMPHRVSGHACRVVVRGPMAVRALHRDGTMPFRPPHDERQMRVHILSLRWPIAGGMAVNTAGMRDHFGRLVEQRQGALFLVGDLGEGLRGLQLLLLSVQLFGSDNHAAERDNCSRCQRGRKYLHLSFPGLAGISQALREKLGYHLVLA
jgi:hypothetical protein